MVTFSLANLSLTRSLLGRAVIAFAATNIDDVFVLTVFFAQRKLKRWHVVAGQYIGLLGLIAISLLGYFAQLIIPHRWIALPGLAPIAIGIKKLFDLKHRDEHAAAAPSRASVLTVAAVTFANGGDNIGIYVPLFASGDATSLLVIFITFVGMIAVWCVAGY